MRLGVVALISISAGLAGCGGDDGDGGTPAEASAPPAEIVEQIPSTPDFSRAQAPGTSIGYAEDADAAVAFVIQDDEAVVYICDGKRLGEWFAGPVSDDRIDLETAGGARVEADVSDDGVTGELTLADGTEASFDAAPAAAETPKTGLFLFPDPTREGATARWIVSHDGAFGVSTTSSGAISSGITVKATTSGSTDTRFSGASSQIAALSAQTKALQTELAAARAEDASLRNSLGTTSTTTTTTGK